MYTQGNWMTASFMWNICLRKQILRPKILWAWERLFISTWLFHFFLLFVLAFIFTSLRFSRVEFYLHLFSLPIFGCFLQKGPLKFSFSKIVTDIEASEIYCFRESLHVSNVSAFREKWRKWQSVRNALRIPGFIVQINKLIVPLIRMFTVELLPL